MQPAPGEFTALLEECRRSGGDATPRLAAYVYQELHRLAIGLMRGERRDHTLQTTGLVHEAYLRLFGDQQVDWRNRAHFLAIAATTMRRILVDYARNRSAAKRGGPAQQKIELTDEAGCAVEIESAELLDLDRALAEFASIDPRASRVVELRYFGGLSADETAEVLGISSKTVKRDWTIAKAWLRQTVLEGKPRGGNSVAKR